MTELIETLENLSLSNKQTKGLKRITIDKYYTKDTVVKICIDAIKENLSIDENDLIIEPSAGNGSFITEIKLLSKNYKFYDLEPENDEIIKQNFLELDYTNFKNKIHIIGNPPFGRQSSLAIKFIKKSCEFCNTISFILPKSFKKDSMKKYFHKNFHLIFELDLPKKSFLVNNTEYDVPCIFQIWEKKPESREIPKYIKPNNFIFVNKNDNPHISFRRVGITAGHISKNIINKSPQSHYFITFTNNKTIDDNIETLKKISFSHDNTVGPKSISKQELIKEFNILL